MQHLAFYDGRIIDPNEPVIRVNDRAHQFGDGVYEAWLVAHGRPILRDEHLARFERSAAALGIVPTATSAQIAAWSDELVRQAGLADAMLYFQWSRGWQLPRNHIPAEGLVPVLSGYIKPVRLVADLAPFSVLLQPDERQTFCHIKTLNLLGAVRAIWTAAQGGYDDALLVRNLDGRDVVTEGTRTNAFAVKDGVVYTGPLGPYLLPGITRGKILELARGLGLPVVEEFRSPGFFQGADEVFYTSCTAIEPVTKINDAPVGTGQPGPVFAAINLAYQEFLAQA
jgi:D-alanine transaminase